MNTPDYQSLEQQYGVTLYPKRDAVMVRGEGASVFDDQGRRYIDCAAGIGVANVGHCHPAVVSALQRQVSELMVVPNTLYSVYRCTAYSAQPLIR